MQLRVPSSQTLRTAAAAAAGLVVRPSSCSSSSRGVFRNGPQLAAVAARRFSTQEERLAPLTPDQIRRIGERSKALRNEHLRLKTEVPPASLDPAKADRPVDADEVRRKRLLYRSKQRGWLEVDLLLGSWAAEHVPRLTTAELDEYEALLNQETIDIFQIVNGQKEAPPELEGSKVLARLQEYANSAPFGKASVQGYEEVKDKTNLI